MVAVSGGGGHAHWISDRTFTFAVVASVVVHSLILLALPGLLKPPKSKPISVPIVARLAPPPQVPVPAPAVQPAFVRPAETAPRILDVPPQPEIARPRPPLARQRVAPPSEPAMLPRPDSPRTAQRSSDKTEPMESVQSAQAPPPPTASPDERPPAAPPPVASEASDPATLGQYRIALITAAKRYKRYPRVALDNNWEGQTAIRMVIGADGAIASISIKTPSGYEVLDLQALEMIRKAKSLTPIPAALRGKGFAVDIPVLFSLKEETG